MAVGVIERADFRRAAAVTFGIWYLVLGSYVATELIAGRVRFLAELPVDVVAVGLVAASVLPLYPLIVRTAGAPTAVRWALLGTGMVIVAIVQSLVNMVENRLLGVIPALSPEHLPLIRERFARSLLSHLYLTFANAMLIVFLVQVRRQAEGRVALAEARAAAERERVTALRFQLNPHFLFNTLNSISSLIVTRRAGDADEMLGRLADFLRASLAADPEHLVALDEEMETVETYLSIEAVRFGARMAVDVDCPPALAELRVPSFILQPLVENAVKYAVAPARRPVTIAVSARVAEGQLVLEVADDGEGLAPAVPVPGLGVGLSNIRARLALFYGDEGRLELARPPGGGFVSRIVVPLSPRTPG